METIDAKNQSIGRVASAAAKILMGKDKPNYRPNVVSKTKVKIVNAKEVKIDPKKMKDKIYQTYSGYPGGQKEITLEKLIEKKGYEEIFRKAVYGMLPGNRLRSEIMKNLEVVE